MTQNIRQLANRQGYTWLCPGCKHTHAVSVDAKQGPSWGFNGNVEQPTFTPSVLARGVRHDLSDAEWEAFDRECKEKALTHDQQMDHPVYGERCHTFVRDGQIQFLDDCTHALKNTTVPIPPWPHAPGTYGGILEPDQP